MAIDKKARGGGDAAKENRVSRSGNDRGDEKNREKLVPWPGPFFAVSALAVVTAMSLVLFHAALDRLLSTKVDEALEKLLSTKVDEDLEKRVRAEITQRLKDRGVSCTGTWTISVPVVFRPGVWDEVADRGVAEESIHRFMESRALRNVAKVHVFGFASADGPRNVNNRLAKQRAQTIRDKIQDEILPENRAVHVEVHGLGEDHMTNGVANSRSARIVACVPMAVN